MSKAIINPAKNEEERARQLARMLIRRMVEDRANGVYHKVGDDCALLWGGDILTAFVFDGRKCARLVGVSNGRPILNIKGVRVGGKIGRVFLFACPKCADQFWAHDKKGHTQDHDDFLYESVRNRIEFKELG